MEYIIIFLVVLFIAIIFSIAGLGGALLYVPLLFWLGIELNSAIPTALLLNAITTGSASVTYLKKKMVMIGIAAPLIVTSVLFAPLGAYFTVSLDERIILTAFSAVIILASIRMLLPVEHVERTPLHHAAIIGGLAGIVIGFTSGLLGIGGGVFAVPLLLSMGFDARNASATSALFVLFTSISGLLGHITTGVIDTELMLFTGAAAFIGAQIGSNLMADHLSSRTVMRIFGMILLIVAAKIIYDLM